jgi:hypothetical protein
MTGAPCTASRPSGATARLGRRGRWAYSPAEPKCNTHLSKKDGRRPGKVRPQFAILGVAIANKCC